MHAPNDPKTQSRAQVGHWLGFDAHPGSSSNGARTFLPGVRRARLSAISCLRQPLLLLLAHRARSRQTRAVHRLRGSRKPCRRRRRPHRSTRIRRPSSPRTRLHLRTRSHRRRQGCSRCCSPLTRSRRRLHRQLRSRVHNRVHGYSRSCPLRSRLRSPHNRRSCYSCSRRRRWFRWFCRQYNLPLNQPLSTAISRGSVDVDSPLTSSTTCWAWIKTTTAAFTAIVSPTISLKRTWQNSLQDAHAAQPQAIGERP